MSGPLLSRQEVADRLGVSTQTLAKWAYQSSGPPYYRLGKHARYDWAEVQTWLDSRRVESAPLLRAAR